MYRKSKAIVMFFIMVLCMTWIYSMPIHADGIVLEVDHPEIGRVTDIIDANVVTVTFSDSTVENIRLIGIDTDSSQEAFDYMKDKVLGNTVMVVYDDQDLPTVSDFVNAYVYLDEDNSINYTLLKNGLANIDKDDIDASNYSEYLSVVSYARSQEVGMWELSTSSDDSININTASDDMLMTYLGVTQDQADDIVEYRAYNSISSGQELGFVSEDFDRDFIEDIRSHFHVITDITTATRSEMASLLTTSAYVDAADEWIRYRLFHTVDSIEDIKEVSTYKTKYSTIEDYITTEYTGDQLATEEYRVNINTASASKIEAVTHIDEDDVEDFVDIREDTDYVFRSLEELTDGAYPWYNEDLYKDTDNLSCITDLNSASDYEIDSLFSYVDMPSPLDDDIVDALVDARPISSWDDVEDIMGSDVFEELKPFISLSGDLATDKAPININTAEDSDVEDYLDLDDHDSSRVENYTRTDPFDSPKSLHLNSDNVNLITLYTNINEASYDELMLMSDYMTKDIAYDIIDYRSYYPFYSLDELKDFLQDDEDATTLYNHIKDFVVFY